MKQQTKERFGGLSGLAIRRPVFTAMVMLGLLVLGVFGFRRLSIDQMPDVEIPVVTVQTVYPGASPETMEREISRRMEEAFNTVEGVDEITSQSLESASLVIVMFDLDRDVDEAAQDIRAKIEGIRRNLPADIETPVVQKFDPSALPILSLALSSTDVPLVELTTLADETVRRRLESVRGVGEVRLAGSLEREIRINLLPERMEARGISVQDVLAALARQNLEMPAGRLERGHQERLLRVTGRIVEPRQFETLIVTNHNGEPVRLGEVARIEDGTEEERSLALVNDHRAVALDILKVSGANTVDVADGVNEAVSELRAALPQGVELQVVRDNSVKIRNSVHDVIVELLLGALLTVVVVMLFLNDWKATAITSLALPVSVVSTFILMNALGFTLNTITLLALALVIGILIDDAIVVIENIVRHREMGADHFEAAGRGTREIILAVMATTLSIVAVFVPVAFMGGIVGRFFYQFGVTVAWATLVSLFVSFTLTPMLAAWWGVNPHLHDSGRHGVLSRFIAGFDRFFDRLIEVYRRAVAWSLRRRRTTLALAAATFAGALFLFPLIGGEFMPAADDSEFAVTLQTPEGSSLTYTREKAEQIITMLADVDEVDYSYTTIGAGPTGTVNAGEVYVKLVPASERNRSQFGVMGAVRARVKQLHGADVAVLPPSMVGGNTEAPLQVEIRGPDIAELTRLAALVQAEVETVPGVVDVDNSLGEPRPEYRIEVERDKANEVGLDVGMVAGMIRPLMAGQTATRWEDPSGEERDVVVQLDPSRRVSTEDVAKLPISVPGPGGRIVSLGQIARLEPGEAPARIMRKNLERIATVTGNVTSETSLTEASSAILERAEGLGLPAGYSVGLGGQTERFEETAGYVVEALLLAVILIFLILASQFESLTQPLAIMLSLPLSIIGVFIALLLTDDTLNMMSMIGVIMLMGLVTKNAILLVDNANEQRRTLGRDRTSALIEAGVVRFRPIMMTTLAMIFGMLPVALAIGEGGGFRAPMARAVIGGLITSTLLTLIVVPVAYTYLDGFGQWVKHRFLTREREKELEEEREHAGLATV